MQTYRFGDFELNLDACELRCRGEAVKLERRPFDLLVLLIERRGRLVSRDEIIAALWSPKVIIDFDSGLNTLVRKVRNALGDSSGGSRFIETVPGRGYRFAAPVTVVAARDSDARAMAVNDTGAEAGPVSAPSLMVRTARRSTLPRMAASILPVFVFAAAFLAWFLLYPEHEPMRIAVLPFENLTGSDELAYLASGLAEDTSVSLGQIDPSELRVIGSWTRAPLDPAPTMTELGSRLGVDFVVLSALRLDRSRVRVTSRLLRVADGEQVWSASFDRELTNVLGLQRELSVSIAEQVRLHLSPEVAAAIDRRQTQNPEAYALYLKGRYEWVRLTPDSIRRALQYFEQATARDETYALAWAGMAFAAVTSLRTADADPALFKPVALDALRRAEQLGPDLAETQYARGYYSLFGELDRRAAREAAKRAITLDPNNAQAHMLLGVSLMGDEDVEALEMMRRARELDPMFALAWANSANVALSAGDREGALEFAKQTVAIDQDFWLGHYYLGSALLSLGDTRGALEAYDDAARLSGGHSLTYSARVALLVGLGRIDEARDLLAELNERAAQQYVPSYTRAFVYALLGETDAAFEWLDRSVAARDVGLPGLATASAFQTLHDDPRFDALLARCGCIAQSDRAR